MTRKRLIKSAILAVLMVPVLILTTANACGQAIDDIMRQLGNESGTFYNYGVDGQVVFEAHCRSLNFTRDTQFDRDNENGEKIEDGSVIKVSCGDDQFSTVGFTSIYISDKAQDNLAVDSNRFYNARIENNDRGIPLVNFVWRDVRDVFVSTSRVASVCDQNNNPILAFAADGVTPYATEVAKSTIFKLDDKNGNGQVTETGYVWVSRGSYTVIDTALLNR